MKQPKYPSLYQINTRVWLTELSRELGRKATLDDFPDNELDRLVQTGFDWIWFLSVWSTDELGRKFHGKTGVKSATQRMFHRTAKVGLLKIILEYYRIR